VLTSRQSEFCLFGSTCDCPFCGDGTVDLGEVCDTAGDSASCDADCTTALCGDYKVNAAAGEACDDGNTLNGDGCTSLCQTSTCVGGANGGAACSTDSECPGGVCL
jgi:cysteine-rich repeat protein